MPRGKPASFDDSPHVPILERVMEFLEEDLVALVKDPNHSKSKSTRPPQSYDMHLHHDLRLKKVVLVPDMPERFIKLFEENVADVDSRLTSFLDDDSLNSWANGLSALLRKSRNNVKTEMVKNETTLVQFYESYRAPFFSEVASAILYPNYLAALPGSRKSSSSGKGKKSALLKAPFQWASKLPTNEGHPEQTQAIADGFLYTNKGLLDQATYLTSSEKRDIGRLIKHGFNVFAVWEYKSLSAGPLTVDGLGDIQGPFPWVTCMERTERRPVAARCGYPYQTHRDEAGNLFATGPNGTSCDGDVIHSRLIGQDTMVNARAGQSKKGKEPVSTSQNVDRKKTQKNNSFDVDVSSETKDASGPSFHKEGTNVSHTSSKDDQESIGHYNHSSTVNVELDGSVTIRKGSADGRMHVIHVTQQGWTEAVFNDSTFIIFSYGNFERIGIRDRRTQTLFISPGLQNNPQKPGYFLKIQLSVYISAILDALERARLMDAKPTLRKPLSTPVPVKINQDVLLLALKQTTSITLRLHGLQINEVDCPTGDTWTFHRVDDMQHTNENRSTQRTMNSVGILQDCTIFLDLETEAFSPRVYPAFLGYTDHRNPHYPTYFSRPLIIKVARTTREDEEIRKEYITYKKTSDKNITSVVDFYGLFTYLGKDITCTILLLEYGGPSLSSQLGHRSTRKHIRLHGEHYKQAFKSLYEKSCAHKNITTQHLVLDTTVQQPEAKIVSLSALVVDANVPELEKDKVSFEKILSLEKIIPRKRPLDEVEE